LRVDSNNCLVGTADICRVDGEVGDIPRLVALGFSLLLCLESFLDGILMTARECGKDQLSSIRVTRVYW